LILKEDAPVRQRRPNILFAIADDHSFPHASAYGSRMFRTPSFDRVASSGVLFYNAFVAAPQCSPSRAAILTGKNIWQLEEAGTHSSYFPTKFPVFTDALEAVGYHIGYTGKAWDPGNWKDAGRTRNPVGPEYNSKRFQTLPTKGISPIDYAANFEDFLARKSSDQPFFFWYGAHEPHRMYEKGSGQRAGWETVDAEIPAFLSRARIEWAMGSVTTIVGIIGRSGRSGFSGRSGISGDSGTSGQSEISGRAAWGNIVSTSTPN
jgi:uncharacterized sulfatase